jgi:citrate lyase beta subunit
LPVAFPASTSQAVSRPGEEKEARLSRSYYKRVIETFKEAEANGLGAVSLEGRMIDVANYRQAEDALVLAEGIAEKKHKRK